MIRTRRGLKWGIPSMLIAVPYLLLANLCTTLLADGGSGWLNLVILVCIWNSFKFLIMGPVSVVLLARARIREAVERAGSCLFRSASGCRLLDGGGSLMGAVAYTRNARPNRDARKAQAAVCKRLAAELGYEVVTEFHDEGRERPALDQLLAAVRDGQVSVSWLLTSPGSAAAPRSSRAS